MRATGWIGISVACAHTPETERTIPRRPTRTISAEKNPPPPKGPTRMLKTDKHGWRCARALQSSRTRKNIWSW